MQHVVCMCDGALLSECHPLRPLLGVEQVHA